MNYEELVLIRQVLYESVDDIPGLLRLSQAIFFVERDIRLQELNPVTGRYDKMGNSVLTKSDKI